MKIEKIVIVTWVVLTVLVMVCGTAYIFAISNSQDKAYAECQAAGFPKASLRTYLEGWDLQIEIFCIMPMPDLVCPLELSQNGICLESEEE